MSNNELEQKQSNEVEDNIEEESNDENNAEEIYEVTIEKLTKLENEIASLKDQLLRKAAEFENYKRRTENDQLKFN